MRRLLLLMCFAAAPALAQPALKVGVLSDMSGPFSDQVGRGSVTAAQMAAEDFAPEARGVHVEIVGADHQNKPDIGAGIARQWVDQQGVTAIVDLPNSGVALAVATVLRERNRVVLASSTATSDLTGKACSPVVVQWVTDTWSQAHSTARALVDRGLNQWFFLTVDYALGLTLERDATAAVTALGGRVLGGVRSPLGTTDFASALLAAQSSGANTVVLANTGADAINSIKQVSEFGLTQSGVSVAALFLMISDVHSLGLKVAQGLNLTTGFYWDLNDATRAWSARFAQRMGGRMPTMMHAGVYSATLAYLRAARDAGTVDGAAVVRRMEAAPIADTLFGPVTIRPDGRAVHAMYQFTVKSPAESRSEWDLFKLTRTIPAADAFRPMGEGGCAMVKG
jgi:branched-chain amino acid transport system substrate-binding protein